MFDSYLVRDNMHQCDFIWVLLYMVKEIGGSHSKTASYIRKNSHFFPKMFQDNHIMENVHVCPPKKGLKFHRKGTYINFGIGV